MLAAGKLFIRAREEICFASGVEDEEKVELLETERITMASLPYTTRRKTDRWEPRQKLLR